MKRPLWSLFAAQAVSMIGSRMSALALPWFVLVTTGSATRTGLVAFAEMLTYVLACAFGGPLIDRLGGRRVSIIADVASTLTVAAVPLLHRTGLSFTVLIGLVTLTGALRGAGDISKRAFFQPIAIASGMDMTRAASLQDGISRLSTLIGAPLGGILIASLNAPTVLLVDATTFLTAAILIALLVRLPARLPTQRPAGQGEAVKAEPYLTALRGGVTFLRSDRLVAALVVMLFATNLFDAAYGSVLMPLWAKEVIGSPIALGVLSAVFAIGAVLGNVVFTAFAPRAPRFALFTAGFILGGGPRFIAAAVTDQLWVIYGVSFLAGLGIAAINPILGAVMYERIPQHMMARVQGLSTAVAWAGIPLGGLLGGWFADQASLRVALLVLGGSYVLVTLVPLVSRRWRDLDRRPTPVEPEPQPVPV